MVKFADDSGITLDEIDKVISDFDIQGEKE